MQLGPRAALLLVVLPAAAGAGTITTRSGTVFDTPGAYLELVAGASSALRLADTTGAVWQFQAQLPGEDPGKRSFDLELRFLGGEPGTAGVILEHGGRTNHGTAHVDIGNGSIHIDVESDDPEVAATVDADLAFDCLPPHEQNYEGFDGWLQTPYCRPFQDLWPGGRPRGYGSTGGALDAGTLIYVTAALVEGNVVEATQAYGACIGPRRVITLGDVTTHAGKDVGRTVVLKEFGGDLPGFNGEAVYSSNETHFARGRRYLVQLVDDSLWRWFESPVAVGNALLVQEIAGKEVLITQEGELVLGFGADGWELGPPVAEPSADLALPFNPPTLDDQIPADFVAWAITPEEAVRAFIDTASELQIPIEGTFHPEPDPRRSWRSEDIPCSSETGGGCSCAQGGGDSLAAAALLLLARRRRIAP
jgi:hypothetical protein